MALTGKLGHFLRWINPHYEAVIDIVKIRFVSRSFLHFVTRILKWNKEAEEDPRISHELEVTHQKGMIEQ